MTSREMAATLAVAVIGLAVIGAVLGLVALTSPVP
jgi:hypothetical protein